MNWEYIWNNREFNEKNIYDFNGYPLKNYDEYNNLINEITKDLDIKIKNPRILDSIKEKILNQDLIVLIIFLI